MMTTKQRTLGLYLHVPFCAAKCRYCDFHSAPAGADFRHAYRAALCRHIAAESHKAKGRVVDTIYVGGGTPTLLGAPLLAEILDTVKAHYAVASDAEITVECNPVTGEDALFEGLALAGFNRLSVGLQSANERELSLLGRTHTARDFTRTISGAKRAGFANISADIMLGIPGQTKESLGQTLDFLLSHDLSHISAYCLRLEEGTPLYLARDTLDLPDDDLVADMEEQTAKTLKRAGYTHYEVSNYAKLGRESKHNLRYWHCQEYLGFGPAAHSYFCGVRYAAPRDTQGYINAVTASRFADLITEKTPMSPFEAREEYVMLGMRLFAGIDERVFENRFGISFDEAYGATTRYEAAGLLTRQGGRIAFTEQGMLVSNAILADWLDFSKGEMV